VFAWLPSVLARIGGYSMPKWAWARPAAARRRKLWTILGGDVVQSLFGDGVVMGALVKEPKRLDRWKLPTRQARGGADHCQSCIHRQASILNYLYLRSSRHRPLRMPRSI
jgi:hypothetical protein